MSDDITALANLDDVETGSKEGEYEPPSEFARPPIAGEYTLVKVFEKDEDFKSGRSIYEGQGFAWFNFKAQIQGGDADGKIVFGGANTMKSNFRNGTTAEDLIRAHRSSARPTTIAAFEETIGRSDLRKTLKSDKLGPLPGKLSGPFNAKLDWEWRCKDCQETFLKGFRNPKSPKKYKGAPVKVNKLKDGSVDHVQVCPGCSQKVGANLIIKSYVVPTTASNGTVATGPAPKLPAAGA
jgi:hypothetical protein